MPLPFDATLKDLVQSFVLHYDQLFQGARAMRESSTYQGILEEGRVEGRVKGQTEAF